MGVEKAKEKVASVTSELGLFSLKRPCVPVTAGRVREEGCRGEKALSSAPFSKPICFWDSDKLPTCGIITLYFPWRLFLQERRLLCLLLEAAMLSTLSETVGKETRAF